MLEKAEGIVLRTVNYGESNMILRLYTREAGKVSLMARGAKKPKNRLASVSQPFMHGVFVYYRSSGMKNLNQGDSLNSFREIRADILKMSYAAYIAELLDKVTGDQEKSPYLFELLLELFIRMNDGGDPEVLTRIFEMKMTAQAGIKPEIDKCTRCKTKEGNFSFSIREAGFLCHRCKLIDEHRLDIQQHTVKLLRTFFYLDIHRLGEISLKKQTKEELKQVLQTYYDEYSGLTLKSKRFVEQLDKWNI